MKSIIVTFLHVLLILVLSHVIIGFIDGFFGINTERSDFVATIALCLAVHGILERDKK